MSSVLEQDAAAGRAQPPGFTKARRPRKERIMTWCRCCTAKSFAAFLTVCIVFLVCLLLADRPLPAAADESSPDVHAMQAKADRYRHRMMQIEDRIRFLKDETEWLGLKINRIEDQEGHVPLVLKRSMEIKKDRIAVLEKQKQRLRELVEKYTVHTKTRDEKLKTKKAPVSQKHQKTPPEEKTILTETEPAQAPPETDTGLTRSDLEAEIKRKGLGDWVAISGSGTCLRLENTLPILFATGSAKIADEYKSFLKNLAAFLQPYDIKVLVNGYADIVPIHTQKYPSNFELGATRAANIVHKLVGYGLRPAIFEIKSPGKYRFSAKSPSRKKIFERRAEITVLFTG